MADLEQVRRPGSVSLRLLQSAPYQNLLDRGRRLFDRKLAARQVDLHRVERFTDAFRQVAHLKHLAVGEDHCALDGVLELADVARPRVLEQELAPLGRNAANVRSEADVVARDEMVDEQIDVLAPAPERWDVNR